MQVIADCCSVDAGACTELLAANPDLSVDPDTTFNFCNLHGNVCTRCANRPCGHQDASACQLTLHSEPVGATMKCILPTG